MSSRPRITKSRYLAGLQCLRRLHLLCYPPGGGGGSDEPGVHLLQGRDVGEHARRAFPGGILVDGTNMAEALATTANLIRHSDVPAIFEATFAHEDTFVRVDVMRRLSGLRWGLIEVKSSTTVKDYHIDDAAFQAWVLTKCNVPPAFTRIMHINNRYVFDGREYDYDALFSLADIDSEVLSRQECIPGVLAEFRDCLSDRAICPTAAAEANCRMPYACEFQELCCGPLDLDSIHVLPRLQAAKRREMEQAGVHRVVGLHPVLWTVIDPKLVALGYWPRPCLPGLVACSMPVWRDPSASAALELASPRNTW